MHIATQHCTEQLKSAELWVMVLPCNVHKVIEQLAYTSSSPPIRLTHANTYVSNIELTATCMEFPSCAMTT